MKRLAALLDRVSFSEWRGNLDGRPTFWSRQLLAFAGFRVSLHRMVAGDDEGCFHSHPAFAVRMVLAGGYVEQLEDGREVTWRPGRIGLVRPDLSHRIARLIDTGFSYSLWLRGPKLASTRLLGPGWPEALRSAALPTSTESRRTS